jgi:hypothetical protein
MARQLSLLAQAVGSPGSFSLSQIKGSNTLTDFSNYKIDAVLGVTQPAAGFNQNFDIAFTFQNEGTQFFRIKNRPENFSFNIPIVGAEFVLNGGFFRRYKNVFNPKNTNCSVSILLAFPNSVFFRDQGFNAGIPNYDSLLNVNVTLHSPPKPSLSITGTTAPPRPGVLQNGKYMGASINISYNAGTYQGVAGTTTHIYYSTVSNSIGTLAATVFNGSGTYRIGFDSTQTVNNYTIAGRTLYFITVRNNFDCQSNTSSVTTAAYV